MGRSPCCDGDTGLKKGPWTSEEDQKLMEYIDTHGTGNWKALPKQAGLNRCGKSCRLRWANYLRPDIKRGNFTEEEDRVIINLHSVLGNKWSKIATYLPGRTDNEIKNYYNTHMRKKLLKMGIDPVTHKPRTDINHIMNLSQLLCAAQLGNTMNPYENILKLQADAAQAAQVQVIQNLLHIINTTKLPTTSIQNTEPTGLLGANNDHTMKELLGGTSIFHQKDINTPTPRQCLDSGSNTIPCNGSQSNTNSGSKGLQMQIQLPKLASSPSYDETSSHQMVQSKINPEGCSTEPTTTTCFDTWDKFLDDNSSDSYWKDILDFTSLLSPISGSNSILQHINL